MNSKNESKRYFPRKIARSIARTRMEKSGVRRINRPRDWKDPDHVGDSFFARKWRDYLPKRSAVK